MRKLYLFCILTGLYIHASAQDVGLTAILSPNTGCALSNSENVTIRIYNYGTDLSGTPFNVSYSLNGAPAVIEAAVFPSFLPNSSVNYTFTTQADLSAPGVHTIDASTMLGGDINASNDAINGYTVTSYAPSNGGTMNGSANICVQGNSGMLSLTGHTGSVQNWEFSQDGGNTWLTISNSGTTQNYSNISVTTMYRAEVQNGVCPPAFSSIATLTVDPATIPGTVSGAATVCATANSGNVTLSGNNGSVLYWISSTDGGSSWSNIANVTNTQSYNNLSQTTIYRAVVQNGSCPPDTSSAVTITVNPATVGGSIAGSDTLCHGINSGVLTNTGSVGSYSRWEFSTTGGAFWTNIANFTHTQAYSNLTTTRMYRALLKSGVCAAAYSDTAILTVLPAAVGGTVNGSTNVCIGSNSGNVTLAGSNGNIIGWESSTNGGSTWSPIANTTNTQAYNNLVTTTMYRAVLQVDTCNPVFSSAATITVDPVTIPGTLTGGGVLCQGSNSGNVTLAGNNGNVSHWESSTDGGSSWNIIANTTTTLPFSNLVSPTLFRAFVISGACPGAYSDTVAYTIDVPTVAGTISASATVCEGMNSGTLTLSGHTGSVLQWEFSTNGGSSWTSLANTTTSQNYNNLTVTTQYRAHVQNGVCAVEITPPVTITVNTPSIGGSVSGFAVVCADANSGSLTVSGFNGNIIDWQSSTDGGTSWTSTGNASPVQNYTNLTQTTWYRVVVQNGVCPSDVSNPDSIVVVPESIGGTLAPSSVTVCAGANSGSITLSGELGQVQSWEFSSDGGNTWIVTTNTGNTQNYSNLTGNTLYRVSVKNGLCPAKYSDTASVTVNPQNLAGNINGGTTVCDAGNSGTLTLTGATGGTITWESSTDGITWNPTGSSGTTESYNNLIQTTWYRAIVSGGVCPADTTAPDSVVVITASAGGNLSPVSQTVCAGNNSGTITISGHNGNIVNWQYSLDGGNTWTITPNNAASQNFNNLTAPVMYRVQIQNGVCPVAYSDTTLISIDPQNIAGSITGATTVCDAGNSGSLVLSGNAGGSIAWERSTDGITWTATGTTGTTESYNNLLQTTWYRAIVSGGVCPADTTSPDSVIVITATAGGSLTPATQTVCAGSNSGTITLSGHNGTIQHWQYSTDGGNTWTTTTNNTASQNFNNLSVATMYRVLVQNGICPAAFSDTTIVSVDAPSVAGTISGATQVCDAGNNGTLTLSGFTGTIVGWEESTDNITFTSNGNTAATQNYTNLTADTWYQVVVQNGVCPAATTASAMIGVTPASVGGTLTPATDVVCSGSNGGTITLSGHNGQIQAWEFSTDGGNTWIATSNTATTHNYSNLVTSTMYRTVVKNGICPADLSSIADISVNPPNDGGLITGNLQVCEGTSDSLILNGYTGTIAAWESSTDGLTWTTTGNTSDIQHYTGISTSTWYRAIVTGGVCADDTSNAVQVIVFARPVAAFSVNDTCIGDPVTFTSTSSIASGSILTHMWDFGDLSTSLSTNPQHLYQNAGIYNVNLIVISDKNCRDTVTAPVEIFALPSAAITADGPLAFCYPGSVTLAGPSGLTYSWSTGESTENIIIDSTAVVVLTTTDPLTGCSNTDSTSVTAWLVTEVSLTPDTAISLGASVELYAEGGDFFNWTPATYLNNPNSAYTLATPLVTTTYTVIAEDQHGCLDSASVTITVNADYNLLIPNLVTPNSDGFNDTWRIISIELYPDNEVVIFNRYGQEVFSMTGYDNSWDGTYNGANLPDGTYHYVLQFNGGEKVFKGSITILRGE